MAAEVSRYVSGACNLRRPGGGEFDRSLYPYHPALYPLLRPLAGDGAAADPADSGRVHDSDMDAAVALGGHRPPPPGETAVQGSACVDYEMMCACLGGCQPGRCEPAATAADGATAPRCDGRFHFAVDSAWAARSRTAPLSAFADAPGLTEWYDEASDWDGGAAHGPFELPADVLLQVLSHALSDMQGDYLLAGRVLDVMAAGYLADDPEILERTVATVRSANVPVCDGRCHQRAAAAAGDDAGADHSCADLHRFHHSLSTFVSHGIYSFTERHAVALSGWFLVELDDASKSGAEIDRDFFEYHDGRASADTAGGIPPAAIGAPAARPGSGGKSGKNPLARRKHRLKQSLYYYNGTADLRVALLAALVRGVGMFAHLSRLRYAAATAAGDGRAAADATDSFWNAARVLATVGQDALRRLPDVDDGSCPCPALGSEAVAAAHDAFGRRTDLDVRTACIEPGRYSRWMTREGAGAGDVPPPLEIAEVVRGFYLRNLVDFRYAKAMGYGDWLVECGAPSHPHDMLVYDHAANFMDDELAEAGDGDDGQERGFYIDEDNLFINGRRLAARYDYTLLKLKMAWNSPWTPESHLSFQPQFREAASTLALCAQRVGVPQELMRQVVAFFHRDWWLDARKECWNEDCQMRELYSSLTKRSILRSNPNGGGRRASGRAAKKGVPLPTVLCKGCETVAFCNNKTCRKDIWQDGHKRYCGSCPFRLPRKAERIFCDYVDGLDDDVTNENGSGGPLDTDDEQESVGSEGEGEDDNVSWESVDSADFEEELGPASKTDAIYSFFEKEYERTEITSNPFTNLYHRNGGA